MRVSRTLILSAAITVAGLLAGGAVADDPEQPLAGVRIAYVHLNQQDEREAWADFLTGQGATFTGVPVHLAAATDWSSFDVIIVASGTEGSLGPGSFGVPGLEDSNAIYNSGLPVVTLYDGASLYDDIPALEAMGLANTADTDSSGAIVTPLRFWNIPLSTGLLPGNVIPLADATADPLTRAFDLLGVGADSVISFAGDSSTPGTHAALWGIGDLYRAWPHDVGPEGLSELGRKVFVNYLYSLLPQPDLEHGAFVPGAARAP